LPGHIKLRVVPGGALGEALYIVENLIKDPAVLGDTAFQEFLRQPFVTNTQDGRPRSRASTSTAANSIAARPGSGR
jgi:hypothetical protein